MEPDSSRRKRGRPRRNPDGQPSPQLHIRLDKAIYEQVKQHGGSPWVRQLIVRELGVEYKPVFRPLGLGCMEHCGPAMSDDELDAELRSIRTAWLDKTLDA